MDLFWQPSLPFSEEEEIISKHHFRLSGQRTNHIYIYVFVGPYPEKKIQVLPNDIMFL